MEQQGERSDAVNQPVAEPSSNEADRQQSLATQQPSPQQQQQLSSSPSDTPSKFSMPWSPYIDATQFPAVKLPIRCYDVALTEDGHQVLAAAAQHGLVEFNTSDGRQLSHWLPPLQSSGEEDSVKSVAAVSNKRAAVSLDFEKVVVLLSRGENTSSGSVGDDAAPVVTWTEGQRFSQLPGRPELLSAHRDVLAATLLIGTSHRVRLFSLSSNQRLSADMGGEYRIGSVSVTHNNVVIGSRETVTGDKEYVIDVLGLKYGDRRRLYKLPSRVKNNTKSYNQELLDVCADPNGSFVCAAVRSHSTCRFIVLSLDGAKELKSGLEITSVAVDDKLLPRLSLSAATVELQKSDSDLQVAVLVPTDLKSDHIVFHLLQYRLDTLKVLADLNSGIN